jgi:hypothetical protein
MDTAITLGSVAVGSVLSALLMTAAGYFLTSLRGGDVRSLIPPLIGFFGAGAGLIDGLLIAYLLKPSPLVVIVSTPIVALVGLTIMFLMFYGLGVALVTLARLGLRAGSRVRRFRAGRGTEQATAAEQHQADNEPLLPRRLVMHFSTGGGHIHEPVRQLNAEAPVVVDPATKSAAAQPLLDLKVGVSVEIKFR